ncbi:MAG: hypothetical protein ACK562_17580 [Acidobacteriota bacterium]|jgi:hypothetical protein
MEVWVRTTTLHFIDEASTRFRHRPRQPVSNHINFAETGGIHF